VERQNLRRGSSSVASFRSTKRQDMLEILGGAMALFPRMATPMGRRIVKKKDVLLT